MRRLRFLLPLLSLLAVSAFGATSPRVRSDMLVSTDWLAHPTKLRRVFVVHVGTPESFARGHIRGARLLKFSDLVVERDGVPNELPSVSALERTFTDLGVGERGTIVLYGDETLWTTRAYFTLDYLGHGARTAILDGGLEKWQGESLPVDVGTTASLAAQPFSSRVDASTIIRAGRLQSVMEKQSAFGVDYVSLIDARAPAAFVGIAAGEGITRAGHIPGAVNVYWRENFVDSPYRLVRSAADLGELYTSLGVRADRPVIVYCRTGMEASATYFVLKYLGYDVALYDGSFSEWNRNPAAPVEQQD